MKQKKRITIGALGTLLLLAAACQTEQLTEPTTPGAGQERTLVIHPVVSPATTTRAGIATRADGGDVVTTPVSLIGGNLTLTLSHNTNPGATPQIAVYSPVAPADAPAAATAATAAAADAPTDAPAPLAYNHAATGDTLEARGIDPDQARALYITAAGNYPLAAQGTALKASSRQTAHAKISTPGTGDIPTDATATTTLPFALNARRTDPAPLAIAADGTTNLPLSITSAGLMLRMKHNGTTKDGKAVIEINSVRCLLTNETAPNIDSGATDDKQAGTASRVVTARFSAPDGNSSSYIDADGIATSYVLFGTLAASEALTAGTPIAEIDATLVTATGGTIPAEEQKTFTLILPRSIIPAAGRLLTYTVHVNHSLATIEGDVEISDFTPGNGDGGEQAGVGTVATADGTQPLDPNLFNDQNTNWIVTGGGTLEADELVVKNVREALNRIYKPENGDGGYNGDTFIDLTLTGVDSIGDVAFLKYGQLRSISLPEATGIGGNAFFGCTALTTASLPAATSIGYQAFTNCTALTTLSLPAAKSIGQSAFFGCTALTTASLPKATSIGQSAFYNCTALTTATLPKATSIGERAFQGCTALTAATLPEAKSIGEFAFDGCTALTAATLPEAKSIGKQAFVNCTALTTATLPKAESIGLGAFNGCAKLTTLSLPAATDIGSAAFNGCDALTTLRLTAVGEIKLQPDALLGFDTTVCALVLNPDKQPTVSGNQWKGATWQSITYAQQ